MTPRLTRILIANRGEVARRIIRTCHAMGLGTAAVHSPADERALHVTDADVAVALAGNAAAESYLDRDQLLAAARRSGADAVHPGYGFLAEDPEFAAACTDAGLVWVGPTPDAMRAMARKVEAKARMDAAGVPLLPGAEVVGDDPVAWHRAADGVGYPLLVKASAGGGGRGMRTVARDQELADAVRAARREAAASFGDPTVFLERHLERPRHVEVQVLGDEHGHLVHLYERDCSLQRRHQKVIEEARAPGLPSSLVEGLHETALAAARAIGYTSAGTVEMLVAGHEHFFLEVNTRLQVEHPVTEAVTGLDLVRLQLEVAMGLPLSVRQEDVVAAGHAIEARLCAEDPAAGFLPSTGRIDLWDAPASEGVRWDTGVGVGSEVSPHYDSMIAKVIALGASRDEAAARLARALRGLRVHGITTNRNALVATLESDPFLDAQVHTAFFDDHPELLATGVPGAVQRHHAVAATHARRARRHREVPMSDLVTPGWRNVPAVAEVACVEVDGHEVQVAAADESIRVLEAGPDEVDAEVDGLRATCSVAWVDAGLDEECVVHGLGWQSTVAILSPFSPSAIGTTSTGPVAPLPGTVLEVLVAEGDHVEPGQLLVVLEAMKVEHQVTADRAAVVTAVLVDVGDRVDTHQPLVELAADLP